MDSPLDIYFVRHEDIDKEAWDRRIHESTCPTLFAEHDMLSHVSPRWNAIVMGNYDAVMPLCAREKWGINYIYPPFFWVPLGIFAAFPVSPDLLTRFLQKIPAKYKIVDLTFHEENPVPGSFPATIHTSCYYRLNLNLPYIEMMQHFSKNTRRDIKEAQKTGLQIDTNIPVQEVIAFFRASKGNQRVVRYREPDYQQLERLSEVMLKRDVLDVIGVCDEKGRRLAGAFFVRDRNRFLFWFSGREPKFLKQKTMFFLIDYYIRQHENSSAYLDFNGSNDANVARFYKSFGATSYQYTTLQWQRFGLLSPLVNLYQYLKKMK
ncbi:MAG: GNAT family N-acetyltransferase [Bacteroidales bacterium]|jgi:hypothetical protein|nr:GNAT family N-acetyltransferase [Bacteroidales bacterium]